MIPSIIPPGAVPFKVLVGHASFRLLHDNGQVGETVYTKIVGPNLLAKVKRNAWVNDGTAATDIWVDAWTLVMPYLFDHGNAREEFSCYACGRALDLIAFIHEEVSIPISPTNGRLRYERAGWPKRSLVTYRVACPSCGCVYYQNNLVQNGEILAMRWVQPRLPEGMREDYMYRENYCYRRTPGTKDYDGQAFQVVEFMKIYGTDQWRAMVQFDQDAGAFNAITDIDEVLLSLEDEQRNA